jgi:hypothetical protein
MHPKPSDPTRASHRDPRIDPGLPWVSSRLMILLEARARAPKGIDIRALRASGLRVRVR